MSNFNRLGQLGLGLGDTYMYVYMYIKIQRAFQQRENKTNY